MTGAVLQTDLEYTRILDEPYAQYGVTMGIGMVLIVLVPLIIVGSTLADNVKDLTGAVRRTLEQGPPPPPAWLQKVPVVGQSAGSATRKPTPNADEPLLEGQKVASSEVLTRT